MSRKHSGLFCSYMVRSCKGIEMLVNLSNGNVNYTTVSKSGTITINDFNGFDPSGKWKIWIVTKGTVSTSTETIKVYYTY